jgi:MFS family permease
MKLSDLNRTPQYVLGLLFAINLVNYVDRQVLFAVLPLLKSDLSLSDARLGMLASAFMLVYMCAAPLVAYRADRGGRTIWISAGIALWSAATFLSGLARGFGQLFMARAAVGVGESGYGAVSPSFVAEHFPKERRGGVLAVFSTAIPVGSALGYVLGGWFGHRFGWRAAFMVVGLPGFALAALAYFLRDPRAPAPAVPRGSGASAVLGAVEAGAGRVPSPPNLEDYLALYRTRSYVASTLAMATMTFSLGGLAVWMPTFFNRFWGLNVEQAGVLFGGLTVVSGLLGSLTGVGSETVCCAARARPTSWSPASGCCWPSPSARRPSSAAPSSWRWRPSSRPRPSPSLTWGP